MRAVTDALRVFKKINSSVYTRLKIIFLRDGKRLDVTKIVFLRDGKRLDVTKIYES